MQTKQHIIVEAKAATTDQGSFVAIAAAYSVDRVGDRIMPGAFAKTIAQWQASGKSVPLHWNHQGEPEDIIGTVDPHSMEETDAGLKVAGQLDLANSPKAKEAWRAMQTGSMSLSFGYMVTEEKQAKDANELHEIDLFEVSVVPGPANADTRFLSLKSLPREDLEAKRTELRKQLDEIEAALEPATEDEDVNEQTAEVTHQASDPAADDIAIECINALV